MALAMRTSVLNVSAAAKVRPAFGWGAIPAGRRRAPFRLEGAAARGAHARQLGRGVCTAVRGRQLARHSAVPGCDL
jgi:hypothetical protein